MAAAGGSLQAVTAARAGEPTSRVGLSDPCDQTRAPGTLPCGPKRRSKPAGRRAVVLRDLARLRDVALLHDEATLRNEAALLELAAGSCR